MKHKKKNTSQLKVNQVRIEFTNKPLTSWGGICTVIAKYFESIELRDWIESNISITETCSHLPKRFSIKYVLAIPAQPTRTPISS